MRGPVAQSEPLRQVNFAQLDDFAVQHLLAFFSILLTAYYRTRGTPFRFIQEIKVHILLLNLHNVLSGIERLGHPSMSVQKHISLIPSYNSVITQPCNVCPLAKQHRLPFPSCGINTEHPFVLLHMDLWGPYKLPSLTECHYFLIVVDDFSRGIVHQTTCSYTPQQNGIVEWKHKHILDMARALLFQSGLPKRFWGESVLTATYLINRLPTPLLNWKSPFEVLYRKPPDYTHLRVFGCLCFASNTIPDKNKFDHRAFRCIFLGYSNNKKAYRVFHLNTNILFDSRDVIFHENVFPFQSSPTNNEPISLPLPIDDPDSDCPLPISTSEASSAELPHLPTTATDTLTPASPPLPLIYTSNRPQRTISKPAWMSDYICSCVAHSSSCTPNSYSKAHKFFVAQCSSIQEPKTYLQASKEANWVAAMKEELQALEKNGTWELTTLRPTKRSIGSKWVYKLKLNPDGSVARYKARLIAKGYNQIEGVDYYDSFSLVANL
ncbi:UNVERIFIED_CONTAM: Retrovirus-related Pol polyprotein from transposon RE2 [Sesamum latifolium]|uniref:Retrovirus-related Pol polyprotein from transposon RE2 n=1 Tax=Sesamum latifolium TaxID=2727402 RepID=A0AAW2UHN1_9LAMI